MIFRRSLLLALVVASLGHFAHAQLFVMDGEVSRSGGIYSLFEPGTKVRVSLDISDPQELAGPAQHTKTFKVPAGVTIGTTEVFGPKKYVFATVSDGGLFEPMTNAPLDGLKLFGEIDPRYFTIFELNMLTTHNVLSSPTFLPLGIPISDFSSAFFLPRGSLNHLSFRDTGSGFVLWSITDYSIVPRSFTPVPEVSVYGAAAGAGLIGLALTRLKRKGRGSSTA